MARVATTASAAGLRRGREPSEGDHVDGGVEAAFPRSHEAKRMRSSHPGALYSAPEWIAGGAGLIHGAVRADAVFNAGVASGGALPEEMEKDGIMALLSLNRGPDAAPATTSMYTPATAGGAGMAVDGAPAAGKMPAADAMSGMAASPIGRAVAAKAVPAPSAAQMSLASGAVAGGYGFGAVAPHAAAQVPHFSAPQPVQVAATGAASLRGALALHRAPAPPRPARGARKPAPAPATAGAGESKAQMAHGVPGESCEDTLERVGVLLPRRKGRRMASDSCCRLRTDPLLPCCDADSRAVAPFVCKGHRTGYHVLPAHLGIVDAAGAPLGYRCCHGCKRFKWASEFAAAKRGMGAAGMGVGTRCETSGCEMKRDLARQRSREKAATARTGAAAAEPRCAAAGGQVPAIPSSAAAMYAPEPVTLGAAYAYSVGAFASPAGGVQVAQGAAWTRTAASFASGAAASVAMPIATTHSASSGDEADARSVASDGAYSGASISASPVAPPSPSSTASVASASPCEAALPARADCGGAAASPAALPTAFAV